MMKRFVPLALGLLLVAGAAARAVADQDAPPPVATPPPLPPAPPGGGPGFPGGPPGFPPGGPPGAPGFPGAPARTDYKELVPVLVDALNDDDGDVRRYAAHTLTRIGRPAVTALLDVLKDRDKGAQVRANAAYVLGKLGPQAREAVPVLTKALKESDRELRRRAAFALAQLVGDDHNFAGMPGGFGGPGMAMMSGGGGSPRPALPDPGVVAPGVEKDAKKPERTDDKPK